MTSLAPPATMYESDGFFRFQYRIRMSVPAVSTTFMSELWMLWIAEMLCDNDVWADVTWNVEKIGRLRAKFQAHTF